MAKFDGSKLAVSANGTVHYVSRKPGRWATIPTACRPDAGTAVVATDAPDATCTRCVRAVGFIPEATTRRSKETPIKAPRKPSKAPKATGGNPGKGAGRKSAVRAPRKANGHAVPASLTRASVKIGSTSSGPVEAKSDYETYNGLLSALKALGAKADIGADGLGSYVWVETNTDTAGVKVWHPQYDASGTDEWIIDHGHDVSYGSEQIRFSGSTDVDMIAMFADNLRIMYAMSIDGMHTAPKVTRKRVTGARSGKTGLVVEFGDPTAIHKSQTSKRKRGK